jgi:hypothetical protein
VITKFVVIKYIVTAAVVVAVSEFAKANDKLGGLIAALPLDGARADLATCRKATSSQNFESRVLHVLVCHPHLADVFIVSIFIAQMGLLADFASLRRVYLSVVLCVCDSVKKFWH